MRFSFSLELLLADCTSERGIIFLTGYWLVFFIGPNGSKTNKSR